MCGPDHPCKSCLPLIVHADQDRSGDAYSRHGHGRLLRAKLQVRTYDHIVHVTACDRVSLQPNKWKGHCQYLAHGRLTHVGHVGHVGHAYGEFIVHERI